MKTNKIFTPRFRFMLADMCDTIMTIHGRFHDRAPKNWCRQRIAEIKVLHQIIWFIDGTTLSGYSTLQDINLIALIRVMDRMEHPSARKLSAFARKVLTDNKHTDIRFTTVQLAI